MSCCSQGALRARFFAYQIQRRDSPRARKISLAVWSITLFLTAQASAAAPNFVLVLADDQGWNGTSVQMDPNVPGSKSDFYQTPNLEALANAGMRFSNGYSSTPVCGSTRAALQTGRSSAQLQMTDLTQALPPSEMDRWGSLYTGVPLTPPAPEPFSADNTSIASMLKQTNPAYIAAHFGKWHLNPVANTLPQSVGYDFGQEVDPLPPDEVDPWGVFELATMTNSFMEDRVNNNEPFFVQVSHKAVHPPVRSRPEIREKYENLPAGTLHFEPGYAAMTEDLDTSVGMVMEKITELGIEDNTYFIYVSDNGAPISLSKSTPLRSGKATLFEGGIRSPFIVSGPNIAASTVSEVPVTTTDLFSTIADLAGAQNPSPDRVEGASLVPVLENAGELPTGMDNLSRKFHQGGELYWHYPLNFAVNSSNRTRPASAIRDGDFKLLLQYGENGAADELFLYDLANDLSETINLAATLPSRTAELKTKLDTYLAAVDASFAFDVKENVIMNWDAAQPGAEQDRWRSTINLDYKGRETWKLGEASSRPASGFTESFQPGLPDHAFTFDGGDQMSRLFFQVGDDGPYKASVASGTPDYDRSATMEFWVRLDSLNTEQVLFESGDETGGISATLGDADSDGKANDLRFRILGLTGPNGGQEGTLKSLTLTAEIDSFSAPTRDFVHIVTVFNDHENDRYGEIYINGALAGRVDGLPGAEESLQWDGYDDAGLGNIGGNGLGGNGGSGDLPFSGGLVGEFAKVRFYNYAINSSTIQSNYNEVLAPASHGIAGTTGDVLVYSERPTNLTLGAAQSSALTIVQERDDTLDNAMVVDAMILGPEMLNVANTGDGGSLLAGTDFTSFLLQFDPLENDPLSMQQVTGTVEFDREIIAIIHDGSLLSATDAIVGSIGNYGNQADRGFDFTGTDFLAVSADQKTLGFSLSLPSDELLQFRILTEQSIVGDFNNDGSVDSSDYLVWENSFGQENGADADRDGDTDGDDFLAWQRQFASSGMLNGSNSTSVPEPAGLTLAILLFLTGVGNPSRIDFSRR